MSVDFQKIAIPLFLIGGSIALPTFMTVPKYVLYIIVAAFFLGNSLLLENLPQESKQLVAYTPSLFMLVALTQIKKKKPRIGMILLLVSLFSLGVYFINEFMIAEKDKKLFLKKSDKIMFLIQIAIIIGICIYIFDSLTSITNIYRNALAK